MGSRSEKDALVEISFIINSRGLTRREWEGETNVLIAPGITIRDLIDASLDIGNLVWRDDKIVVSGKSYAVKQ